MNRNLKIVIGLFLVFIIMIATLMFRYNINYGNSLFQKSMMVGCMFHALDNLNHEKSKTFCECTISKLLEKYSDTEIKSRNLEVVKEEKKIIKDCANELLDK
jgi:hypothetical protein